LVPQVCNDGVSFKFATEAYILKLKRSTASPVLTELKDIAQGNKMKMTHLWEWCSIQTDSQHFCGSGVQQTDDSTSVGVVFNIY
jgi:hypothetical protein